jgi:hypothetical protein
MQDVEQVNCADTLEAQQRLEHHLQGHRNAQGDAMHFVHQL